MILMIGLQAVLEHHEREDGTGYPFGKARYTYMQKLLELQTLMTP